MAKVINSTGFVKWLKRFSKIECPEKDLYEDIKRDQSFPANASYVTTLQYLVDMHACEACINVFKTAWKEYNKH